MTVRTQRRLLWTLTAGASLAVPWPIWRTWRDGSTIASIAPRDPIRAQSIPRGEHSSQPIVAVADMQACWSRDLRGPLFDPPPPPATASPLPPPLQMRLLGTILEGDDAQAILMTASGDILFPRIGDRVENVVIERIESSGVTVRYNEQPVVLQVVEE